jgi:radical SAM superfamily enzyme YgiQ (UPF0313 family)
MRQSPTSYAGWFERAFPRLSGHGGWLRGKGLNLLPPDEYEARPYRVLIARLSTAIDTAESMTHGMLYAIARDVPGIFPDLAFLPPPRDGRIMAADGVPWLLGLVTRYGARDFNMVALSNSIVQEMMTIIPMLHNSGVPISKRVRLDDPAMPLILLGGANALHTSALWTDDPPVDGIFIGESAATIAGLFAACRDGNSQGLTKREILKFLESVPGFFQPDRPRPIAKQRDRFPSPPAADMPVLPIGDRMGAGVLPISEGCPCFCGFCAESWARKPYREIPLDALVNHSRALKIAAGAGRIDLFGFNFNMHRDLYPLIWELCGIFPRIGLKSQRFDYLARDPDLLGIEQTLGKSSITCGLEGISARLRRYLQKALDDRDLHSSLQTILASPIRELKIFLLAIGKEDDEDFDEFRELLDFITTEIGKSGRNPRLIFSTTPLVRFPWTPLEFEDAPDEPALQPIIGRMRAMVRARGFEFRMAMELPEYFVSQVLVRAADPRIAAAYLDACETTEFIYYRALPDSFAAAFKAALRARGIEPKAALAGHSPDAHRPWTAINPGVSREFMVQRHADAAAFIDKGYCLGRPGRAGACTGCAACDDEEQRGAITAPRMKSPYTAQQLHDRIRKLASREEEIALEVDATGACRGLPRAMIGASLARALMLVAPEIVDAYRGYRRSYWEDDRGSAWVTGLDFITLAFDSAALRAVRQLLDDPASFARVNSGLDGWCRIVRPHEGPPPRRMELEARAPYAFDGNAWCGVQRLKYTLRKKDGWSVFDFTKEAIRRGIVFSMRAREDEGIASVELTVGDKFDAAEFARTAFVLPEKGEWVRIGFHARRDEC